MAGPAELPMDLDGDVDPGPLYGREGMWSIVVPGGRLEARGKERLECRRGVVDQQVDIAVDTAARWVQSSDFGAFHDEHSPRVGGARPLEHADGEQRQKLREAVLLHQDLRKIAA